MGRCIGKIGEKGEPLPAYGVAFPLDNFIDHFVYGSF